MNKPDIAAISHIVVPQVTWKFLENFPTSTVWEHKSKHDAEYGAEKYREYEYYLFFHMVVILCRKHKQGKAKWGFV